MKTEDKKEPEIMEHYSCPCCKGERGWGVEYPKEFGGMHVGWKTCDLCEGSGVIYLLWSYSI